MEVWVRPYNFTLHHAALALGVGTLKGERAVQDGDAATRTRSMASLHRFPSRYEDSFHRCIQFNLKDPAPPFPSLRTAKFATSDCMDGFFSYSRLGCGTGD